MAWPPADDSDRRGGLTDPPGHRDGIALAPGPVPPRPGLACRALTLAWTPAAPGPGRTEIRPSPPSGPALATARAPALAPYSAQSVALFTFTCAQLPPWSPGSVTLRGYEGSVTSVSFSPDGRTAAAGFNPGGVVLWDVATRRRLADDSLPMKAGIVSGVATSAPTAGPSRPDTATSAGAAAWCCGDVATRPAPSADDPLYNPHTKRTPP